MIVSILSLNYHPDHLGSTNLVTNQSSGVVEVNSYSPYGEIIGGGIKDGKKR